MFTKLTAERVRGDLDALSRGGLALDDFVAEAVATLQRAVPLIGACVGTHDPATLMLTSSRKYGALAEADSQDLLFAAIEYGSDDPSSFRALALTDVPAVGVHQSTRGQVARSERTDRLVRSVYGFGDESRVVFRDALGVWGGMALFRDVGDQAFHPDEIGYLGTLSESFARGVRSGILTRLALTSRAPSEAFGPAVVIVDANDEVSQISLGARERMAQFGAADNSMEPLGLVMALVAAARRIPGAPGARLPRARVRTASGSWLVLHASPLSGPGGAIGDVVVTIEEARPAEVVELIVAAFGLSPRERDVARLVLQGVDTKQIAADLHVSAYTVQDHLKSVFDKADVRSRRELIAKVYFDQYLSRRGAEVGPSGWFLD